MRAVKAVLASRRRGKIPGLIQPSAYQALAVPTMIVTGTADLVPGLVTDPADHLFPIESAPAGGKYALVVDASDHKLVAGTARPGSITCSSRSGCSRAAMVWTTPGRARRWPRGRPPMATASSCGRPEPWRA
jgi:hypothetical protein